MKLFSINSYLAVVLTITIFACGGKSSDTPKTVLEILSKNWKILRVTINGAADNSNNYSGFRIVLQQNGTYAVTLGNSPVNIVLNSTNNGRWAITDSETAITFDQSTSNEFKVILITKTETGFSIKFKLPKSINKTEPEYLIEFILAP